MKKLTVLFLFPLLISAQADLKLAVLKYKGGGDWYANPTSLKNLSVFCNEALLTNLNPDYATVDVSSDELFNYPYVHMTGHGNVVFDNSEVENLRSYLNAGGFLHIDDNYGMDEFIRPEMRKVFPESEFVEIPFDHPIFHQTFEFNEGLPKVHEHDKNPAQAFGIFKNGRLLCLYTYECDLGDGWEDQEVHNDPEEIRMKALKMGANIIEYVFNSEDIQ